MSNTEFDYSGWSAEDLRRELRATLKTGAEVYMKAATIVAELEKRGEDCGLPEDVKATLMRVASGQVLPELLFYLANDKGILGRAAESYSLAEQRRIAEDEPIAVAIPSPETPEKYTHVMRPPSKFSRKIAAQVFGPKGIKSVKAQIVYLQNEQKQRADEAGIVHRVVAAMTADQWETVQKNARRARKPVEVFLVEAAIQWGAVLQESA